MPPTNDRETIQREWDHLQAEATFDHLLSSAPDDSTRARLLAVSAPESGAWLHALPISSLGLRLDDVSVHISVALRLGLPVCAPHACKHCGTSVSSFCLHSLFCKRGSMRFHWHAALNDVILRSLSSAGYSCLLGAFGPLEIRW